MGRGVSSSWPASPPGTDSVRHPYGRSRAACPRAANVAAGDRARRPPPGRPLHPEPGRSTGRCHHAKMRRDLFSWVIIITQLNKFIEC